jgi:hypothetical protein
LATICCSMEAFSPTDTLERLSNKELKRLSVVSISKTERVFIGLPSSLKNDAEVYRVRTDVGSTLERQ